jgi:hypothetical protein
MGFVNLILLVVFMAISVPALALDKSDTGTYVVLSSGCNPTDDPKVCGQPTNMVFFFSSSEKEWSLENRNPDGSWQNVTCDAFCELHKSSQDDMKQFFPANVLKIHYAILCS